MRSFLLVTDMTALALAVAGYAGAQAPGAPPAEPAARTFLASAWGGSLKAALAAIGEEPATLVVDTTLACDTPAIPTNVELVVPRGGRIMLGDAPLTVEGGLSAGRYAIFSETGAVSGLKDACPEWFGAGASGTTDDTAAVQRALDAVGAREEARQGGTLTLTGRYAVTRLLATHFGTHIHSDNAWLVARPGSSPYLLRFTPNAHSSTITGKLFLDLDHNLGYGCAINVNARHFIANNVEIWRAPLAWLIGDPAWATSGIPGDAERGDSEIEIIGGATPHCLRGVEAVGANTIVKFTGVFLYSFPWTLRPDDPRREAWEAADCTLIRVIGALVYMDSGGIANFNTKPMIDAQPIATTHPEYFSEYGKVFVNSAHVEAGNFFATSNPHGIISRGRSNCLSMIGCNGYLSSDNPVVTTDALFTGGILIKNCGFYRAGRTSPVALIGSPETTVDIDSSSFWDASPEGLNVVRGGTQKFAGRMILHVQGADQTVGLEGDVVRFRNLAHLPDGADFEACYDPVTGAFRCPYGGLANVHLRAAIGTAGGDPGDTSQVQVLVNGSVAFERRVAGYGAEVDYTLPVLSEGDKVAVRLAPSAAQRLDGGVGTYLQLTASRY
jgi:hypothetical protein